MKITIIHCSFIYTGGGERIVLEQLSHLRDLGYDVECYAPIIDFEKCFPDIIQKYNIKTFLPQLPRWFPLRHAVILLLSCLLIPFFVFRFRKTTVFVGENQPGAWLAFVLATLLRKPYIAFLNHPNRILYPRAHEDWATVKDFKFLSMFFGFFRPVLAYLDRISIVSASERYVNGFFIGKEIESIYQCSWVACPSGTPYLADYAQRASQKAHFEIQPSMFMPVSFYADKYFSYWNSQSLFKVHQQNLQGSLIGGEIENRFLSQRLLYSSDQHRVLTDDATVNGFNLNSLFILYTGRHQPWKRIDWLVEIFSLLLALRKDTDVFLVIPGPHTTHTEELLMLAQNLDVASRVKFLGEISQTELFALYRHAAVYAFPSEREDFGIVVIEAMGQGLPVVAWNVGGPTDTVVDGETGFLVDGYDKQVYAERLDALLADPLLRERMGKAGIERVKHHFSWDSHVRLLQRSLEYPLVG